MPNNADSMKEWAMKMQEYKNMEPYTDEWWKAMTDAMVFVPENMREIMMNGFIQLSTAM